jgi:iron complex outermembrane recepter protein
MPVGNALKMNFGLDAQYTSHYVTALNNRADSVQPGYTLLNSNVSLGSSNEFWQVAFIANNITNKITTGACTVVAYNVGQVLPGSITVALRPVRPVRLKTLALQDPAANCGCA